MIHNVLHPTDFSPASEVAFYHALRLAIAARARLNIVHVTPHMDEVHRSDFPKIAQTLERWGQVAAVESLRVNKIKVRGSDPVDGVMQWLGHRYADFIVQSIGAGSAEHARRHASLDLARTARLPALFLPEGCRGFVDVDTGAIHLDRVLVPVDVRPEPGGALAEIARLVNMLRIEPVQCHILHVGESTAAFDTRLPHASGCIEWGRETRTGDVVEMSSAVADKLDASLVVLATEGRHGFLDAWRGSTTERIVRACRRPILTVPVAG